MIPAMKLLLLLLLIGVVVLGPFLALKRPWAVRLWARVRLLFVIYVIVILTSAIVGLALRWHDIYG